MCWRTIASLRRATDIPLNADFENGFADDPDERRRERDALHRHRRRRAFDRGFAADKATPLYDFDLRAARVKAARAAIDKAGGDVVFTARTEGFIRGRPDIDETIRRLKAFADAGADCLYSPGIKTREHIERREGGRRQGHQLPQLRRAGFTVSDLRGAGRAAHQRRRLAGARARMDAFIKRRDRDRRARQVRRLQDAVANGRAQQLFRRHAMNVAQESDPVTGQPVGAPVDTKPAPRPGPVTLQGRFGRVERLEQRHTDDLWEAVRDDDDALDLHVGYGPFADAADSPPGCRSATPLDDPYSYAVVDGRRAAPSASRP